MYCWEQWHEHLMNLTYPNFDIFIADNSPTLDNVNYMNRFERVRASYTKDKGKGQMSRMNDSHKQCIDYAIKNDYEWIFHLESDVFPPLDVIERLLARKRAIIAGTYDIFVGSKRTPMIQLIEGINRTEKAYNVIDYLGERELCFFNGKVNRVHHAGLGCILIHRDIFNVVKFRVKKGIDMHTDTFFANDCYQTRKDIYVDTTIQCKHYNIHWTGREHD